MPFCDFSLISFINIIPFKLIVFHYQTCTENRGHVFFFIYLFVFFEKLCYVTVGVDTNSATAWFGSPIRAATPLANSIRTGERAAIGNGRAHAHQTQWQSVPYSQVIYELNAKNEANRGVHITFFIYFSLVFQISVRP